MQSINSYILIQGIICAIINMIVNPGMSWISNRRMEFTPLAGIVIDMTITCLIMSAAITFFTTSGVREALKAGNIKGGNSYFTGKSLSRFPRKWWTLGMLLGFICAILLVPMTIVIFTAAGLSGLSFLWLVIFKAVYTGSMAFIVTALVILRQIEAFQ